MVLSSPIARGTTKASYSPKARVSKGDASSTVKNDVGAHRRGVFLLVTGSLISVALTLNSFHWSMLATSKDDVNQIALVIASITTGVFPNNVTVGRELSNLFIRGVALNESLKSVGTSAAKDGKGNEGEDINSATLPSASTRENCFPHNSEAWLKGPRLGNLDESLMNDDFVKLMTLELPYMLSLPGKLLMRVHASWTTRIAVTTRRVCGCGLFG
jgi:mRNA-degrading endonuclease toxin of MazEF toxin-antitoxin module